MTLAELLAETVAAIGEVDARWVVCEASGWEPAELALHLDDPVTVGTVNRIDSMVPRVVAGEPLQHVLGHWQFRTLDLLVDRRVLIPRPETEQVVDAALAELPGGGFTAVDLGTGSGAIALSIGAERSGSREVWATDASADALDVCRANLAGLGVRGTGVHLALGDWFEALPSSLVGTVDLIVSNPPYVCVGDEVGPGVDREPAAALYAGADGLDALRVIVAGAPTWLARPGSLVVELDPRQAAAVVDLALAAGAASADVGRDLTGRDRWVVARWR